jgi:hypothetical protein
VSQLPPSDLAHVVDVLVSYPTRDQVLELVPSWRSDLAVTIVDDSVDSDPHISDVTARVRALR